MSERLVGIEVRHGPGAELITPGLLNLGTVELPEGLAHDLQALEDGQGLLGRPVGGSDHIAAKSAM